MSCCERSEGACADLMYLVLITVLDKMTQGRKDLFGLQVSGDFRLQGLLLPLRLLSTCGASLVEQRHQLKAEHEPEGGGGCSSTNIRVGPADMQENSFQGKTLRQDVVCDMTRPWKAGVGKESWKLGFHNRKASRMGFASQARTCAQH